MLDKCVEFLMVAPIIGKGCLWFRKKWTRPLIVWGLFDCPSSKRADYYIRVKNKRPVQNIKFSLKPIRMLPTDYQVTITTFFQQRGCEHIQESKVRQENFKKHKEIEFDLPAAGLFRLVIVSSSSYMGSLLPQNYEGIEIKHSEAKICCKHHKFP